jgi:hypothetical protein
MNDKLGRMWNTADVAYFKISFNSIGRTVAQGLSCRPLSAESRVLAQVSHCGICGGQSGIESGFTSSYLVFTCKYYFTVALHSYIIFGSGRSSETQSLTIDNNNNNILYLFWRYCVTAVDTLS